MKLYMSPLAPNPRKVLVYLKEKGIEMPLEKVDIMSGQTRTPEYLAKNPLGGLPVLELEDGSVLTESLPIMEYLEELHPEKPMLGTTPLERARVRELERISDFGVLGGASMIFQNTSPLFAARMKQSPDTAENGRKRAAASLKVLDARIGDKPFVAGDRPTIADCTLLAALDFGARIGMPLDAQFTNVARWYQAFKQRPSAQG